MAGPLPRPEGHCEDDAVWADFSERLASKSRADIGLGHVSDFAVAHNIVMATGLDLMVAQTAAKDRIRWLSVQLAAQLAGREAHNGSPTQAQSDRDFRAVVAAYPKAPRDLVPGLLYGRGALARELKRDIVVMLKSFQVVIDVAGSPDGVLAFRNKAEGGDPNG